jgi:hypothetical protein
MSFPYKILNAQGDPITTAHNAQTCIAYYKAGLGLFPLQIMWHADSGQISFNELQLHAFKQVKDTTPP